MAGSVFCLGTYGHIEYGIKTLRFWEKAWLQYDQHAGDTRDGDNVSLRDLRCGDTAVVACSQALARPRLLAGLCTEIDKILSIVS